jgi:hypothetical protein
MARLLEYNGLLDHLHVLRAVFPVILLHRLVFLLFVFWLHVWVLLLWVDALFVWFLLCVSCRCHLPFEGHRRVLRPDSFE